MMAALNELSPQTTGNNAAAPTIHTAVLDKAHLGDIRGAFGSIAEDDFAPRSTLGARLKTLLAILGPGLIVMVGDNDAGAFGTYTQAGQNYGTTLLWTLVLLIPVLYIHPPAGQMIHDMMVPKMPEGAALNEVMLLIIAIVGTTVAPWQLFFQQSYVIDKRITPRFIRYERIDLWIGIGFVVIGAAAMMAFATAAFAGRP